MRGLDIVTATLVIIGGLNWGLVGFAEFDLVAALFGRMTPLSRAVYVLVGLSALYQLLQWNAMRRRWTMTHAHG